MTERSFDPDALIATLAPALGLDAARFDREKVADNLSIAARFARLLEATSVEPLAEEVPAFTPVVPAGATS